MNDEQDKEKEPDLLTGLFQTAIQFYSREAVIGALDYIAGLDEAAVKSFTTGMPPDQAERVYRVWQAARTKVGLPSDSSLPCARCGR